MTETLKPGEVTEEFLASVTVNDAYVAGILGALRLIAIGVTGKGMLALLDECAKMTDHKTLLLQIGVERKGILDALERMRDASEAAAESSPVKH